MPSGAPPPNPVRVTLTLGGRRIYETFTDLSGRFSFGGLARGAYQLIAEGDGSNFETTTVYAEVTAYTGSPQVFTQNIQLLPKTGKPLGRAAVVGVEELDTNVPEQARKEYQKGVKQATSNNPDRAIKHFKEAIAAHPQFYSAQLALAEQHSKKQQYDEAIAAYKRAIELKSDRADPYTGIGVVLVKLQRYQEAIEPLRHSISVNDKSSTAFLFLGLAETMTGDYASAETHLLRAYELDKLALVHIYLANLYELMGQPAKAIQHLQTYLKENPSTPHAPGIRDALDKLRKKLPKG